MKKTYGNCKGCNAVGMLHCAHADTCDGAIIYCAECDKEINECICNEVNEED